MRPAFGQQEIGRGAPPPPRPAFGQQQTATKPRPAFGQQQQTDGATQPRPAFGQQQTATNVLKRAARPSFGGARTYEAWARGAYRATGGAAKDDSDDSEDDHDDAW